MQCEYIWYIVDLVFVVSPKWLYWYLCWNLVTGITQNIWLFGCDKLSAWYGKVRCNRYMPCISTHCLARKKKTWKMMESIFDTLCHYLESHMTCGEQENKTNTHHAAHSFFEIYSRDDHVLKQRCASNVEYFKWNKPHTSYTHKNVLIPLRIVCTRCTISYVQRIYVAFIDNKNWLYELDLEIDAKKKDTIRLCKTKTEQAERIEYIIVIIYIK